MNVVEQLRPRAEHLTSEHADAILRTVMASPAPTRRRWRGRAAAVCVAGLVVAGGAAYAANGVPQIVLDRFEQFHNADDGWPEPITNERLVADVALSNGNHARVWYADTTDGGCEIRDMSGTVTEPSGLPGGCALWQGDRNSIERGTHWQLDPAGPAVVYGEFNPAAAADRVVVHGPGWTRSLAVSETFTFAAEVPAGTDGDRIRFSYLDARGHVLGSKVSQVTLESE